MAGRWKLIMINHRLFAVKFTRCQREPLQTAGFGWLHHYLVDLPASRGTVLEVPNPTICELFTDREGRPLDDWNF